MPENMNSIYSLGKGVWTYRRFSRQKCIAVGGMMGVLAFCLGRHWISSLGVGLFSFLLWRILLELGNGFPFDTLIALVASLQWIIGPILAYSGWSNHYKYHIYVDEAEYMSLAVPGIYCFSIGLFLMRRRSDSWFFPVQIAKIHELMARHKSLPMYFIATGVCFSVLRGWTPPVLNFPMFVLSNIKYIGIIYMLFSDHRQKWLIMGIGIVFTALSSLQHAMFHDLLLWSVILMMYACVIARPSISQKLLFLVIVVAMSISIQLVKRDFREYVWKGYEGNKIALFADLLEDKLADTTSEGTAGAIEPMVIRINQGWIVSRIMERVPDHIPYAGGETVKDALKATLLPRFLAPGKTKAGGKKNYEQFTDYTLNNTSMGISLLGEGYANYGTTGALIFLFITGLAVSSIIHFVRRASFNYPALILWIPLILLHAIKAETELVVVLNYVVKSAILTFLFLWGSSLVMKKTV